MAEEPAGRTGSEEGAEGQGPPAGLDSDAQEAELQRARGDAAKARIRARDARQAAEDAQAELQSLQGKFADLAKVLDPAAQVTAGPDAAAAAEATAKKSTAMARDVIVRTDFKAEALRAGLDPDLATDAYELARTQGYLEGIDVDMSDGTVEGTEAAVAKFLEDKPVYKQPDQKQAGPKADKRPPGGPQTPSIDLKNLNPADIHKIGDAEWDALVEEGLLVPTGRYTTDLEGNRVPEYWLTKTGGNTAQQEISRAKARWTKQQGGGSEGGGTT